jgi:hypothetical protein
VAVQLFRVEGIGQRLRAGQVGDAQEGVVFLHELDALALQRARQGEAVILIKVADLRRARRVWSGKTSVAFANSQILRMALSYAAVQL